jgi:hypothetical protein
LDPIRLSADREALQTPLSLEELGRYSLCWLPLRMEPAELVGLARYHQPQQELAATDPEPLRDYLFLVVVVVVAGLQQLEQHRLPEVLEGGEGLVRLQWHTPWRWQAEQEEQLEGQQRAMDWIKTCLRLAELVAEAGFT